MEHHWPERGSIVELLLALWRVGRDLDLGFGSVRGRVEVRVSAFLQCVVLGGLGVSVSAQGALVFRSTRYECLCHHQTC